MFTFSFPEESGSIPGQVFSTSPIAIRSPYNTGILPRKYTLTEQVSFGNRSLLNLVKKKFQVLTKSTFQGTRVPNVKPEDLLDRSRTFNVFARSFNKGQRIGAWKNTIRLGLYWSENPISFPVAMLFEKYMGLAYGISDLKPINGYSAGRQGEDSLYLIMYRLSETFQDEVKRLARDYPDYFGEFLTPAGVLNEAYIKSQIQGYCFFKNMVIQHNLLTLKFGNEMVRVAGLTVAYAHIEPYATRAARARLMFTDEREIRAYANDPTNLIVKVELRHRMESIFDFLITQDRSCLNPWFLNPSIFVDHENLDPEVPSMVLPWFSEYFDYDTASFSNTRPNARYFSLSFVLSDLSDDIKRSLPNIFELSRDQIRQFIRDQVAYIVRMERARYMGPVAIRIRFWVGERPRVRLNVGTAQNQVNIDTTESEEIDTTESEEQEVPQEGQGAQEPQVLQEGDLGEEGPDNWEVPQTPQNTAARNTEEQEVPQEGQENVPIGWPVVQQPPQPAAPPPIDPNFIQDLRAGLQNLQN